MKKLLKVLLIIFLVIVVLVIGLVIFLTIASGKQNAPKEYWNAIASEGTIEKEYNKLGSYEFESKVYDAPKVDSHDNNFVVYMPKEEGTYPLVVMVNGSGTPWDKYKAVFEHFASWGYVVVGCNYEISWDGKHASETLDFALNTKEIADKVDTSKVAVCGHSQGGEGAFNAALEYDNSDMYKAVISLSPTNQELALGLKWGFNLDTDDMYAYRLENVTIPTMIIAGTGKFDSETVTPLYKMEDMFEQLNTDVVMARLSNNVDHGAVLYEANGYVIAWLDYYLKGIETNGTAFFGNEAEIKNNTRYQDFTSQKVK